MRSLDGAKDEDILGDHHELDVEEDNMSDEGSDEGEDSVNDRFGSGDSDEDDDNNERVDPNEYNGIKLHSYLQKILIKANSAGAFPQAASVQLMNLLSAPGLNNYHWIEQDIISRESRILPFRMTWYQYGYHDDHEYFARTPSDGEIFGLFGSNDDLENAVEGGVWCTTADGYRWSTSLHQSGYRHWAAMKVPRLENREQYVARRGMDLSSGAVGNLRMAQIDATKDAHVTREPLGEALED